MSPLAIDRRFSWDDYWSDCFADFDFEPERSDPWDEAALVMSGWPWADVDARVGEDLADELEERLSGRRRGKECWRFR